MAEKKQAGYNKKMQRQETRECQECSYHKKCGGCEYSGIPYEEQLQKKEKRVARLLREFGKVEPIVGMSYPYYYRNKVHAVYAQKKNGQVICGTYEKDSHRVVDIESCLLEDKQSTAIIRDIRGLLRSFKIKPYNEDTGYGLLRHVLVRHAHATGEVMVVLVIASPILPSKNNFVKALRQMHPEITTVVLNINGRNTSMVLGDQEKVLYGKGYIVDELLGMRFRISAKSFYQVNPIQTKHLYQGAISLAGLSGKERVLDAYCGTGTIGMIASRDAKEVVGVELNRDAVRDAITNAKTNQARNIRFVCEDATEYICKAAANKEHFDVVLMDPPRAGSTKEFVDAVISLAPERVVYVSCNPETLARDLKWFCRAYRVETIRPYDMFPLTGHVETVCLLTREKSVKSYAYVDITPSELGMGGKVKKPTYKQIQAYVLETHGLKVSPLYIANVKDEFGLEKQFSYEEAGMSAKKRPNCPSEKRAAIIDALIHFGMLDEDARETE